MCYLVNMIVSIFFTILNWSVVTALFSENIGYFCPAVLPEKRFIDFWLRQNEVKYQKNKKKRAMLSTKFCIIYTDFKLFEDRCVALF